VESYLEKFGWEIKGRLRIRYHLIAHTRKVGFCLIILPYGNVLKYNMVDWIESKDRNGSQI
jgi:hypothetical protein